MRSPAPMDSIGVTKGAIVNTILFATDGSPSAQKALGEAVELAKETGWGLRVLTVWQTPLVTGYGFAPAALVPELAHAEKDHATKVAEAAVAAAAEAGVEATAEIRNGLPATEICDAASEDGIRLVVIGAHGWGAFKRVLFGSVSNHVLHDAPCPVLVVRMTESELGGAREEEVASTVEP
jgi:nucleotide-binding universal stress UspA family protein